MEEKTLEFLRHMRDQIEGKDSREVHSGEAAHELGMAPGNPEHESRLSDLMSKGYLLPHPDPDRNDQGWRIMSDAGLEAGLLGEGE